MKELMFQPTYQTVLHEILQCPGGLWHLRGNAGSGKTSDLVFLNHELLEWNLRVAVYSEGAKWYDLEKTYLGSYEPDLSWNSIAEHYEKRTSIPLPIVGSENNERVHFLAHLEAGRLTEGSVVILDGAFLLRPEPKPGMIGGSHTGILRTIAQRHPRIRFVYSDYPPVSLMSSKSSQKEKLVWKRLV